MRQNLTYRNAYLLLVAVALLVGCKATKQLQQDSIVLPTKSELLRGLQKNQNKLFSTLYIEKFNLRIDYQGQFRSQKSSLYHVADSLIHITITSSFSIPVACFLASPNNVLIIDRTNKVMYEAGYPALEHKIGFPVNYGIIENIIFGVNTELVKRLQHDSLRVNLTQEKKLIKLEYKKQGLVSGNYHTYIYSIDPLDFTVKYLDIIYVDQGEKTNIFEAQYKYVRSKDNNSSLQSVLISTNYNKNPMEIEIEYKNPVYNEKHSVKLDSTYTVKPLFPENEH